jgi:hypothetical protein
MEKRINSAKRLRLPPFSEAELLKGMTPETAHADIIANPIKEEF